MCCSPGVPGELVLGSANHGPFLIIVVCWPESPQSVKSSSGQCLWRKCIRNPQGLRNQPLFFARCQSCGSNHCSKVSLQLVPHGPCGGEAAGFQMRVCHSLNILWPFQESRASFGASLFLTGVGGDGLFPLQCQEQSLQWLLHPWCRAPAWLPEHLAGFAQVSRDNFLWESLYQLSALAWNNPSLRPHLLFVCRGGCTIKGRGL